MEDKCVEGMCKIELATQDTFWREGLELGLGMSLNTPKSIHF